MLAPMMKKLLSPKEKAEASLKELRAHVLYTDGEMEAIINRKYRRLCLRNALGLLFLLVGAFLLFWVVPRATGVISDSLGSPEEVSHQINHSFSIFAVGLVFLIAGFSCWSPRPIARIARARKFLKTRQYGEWDLIFTMDRLGSLAPQKIMDSIQWSLPVEDLVRFPAIEKVWATWLLSNKPVRVCDVRTMVAAVDVAKEAEVWLLETGDALNEENEQFKNDALELVSSPVLSQIRMEVLDRVLEKNGSADASVASPSPRL